MSAAPSLMVGVAAARDRAGEQCARRFRDWAADVFLAAAFEGEAGSAGAGAGAGEVSPAASLPVFELSLRPPTERQAIDSGRRVREWVDEWRALPCGEAACVTWAERRWSRVGAQEIPTRLRVEGAGAIADFAGWGARWRLIEGRMDELAGHVRSAWGEQLASCDRATLRAAVRRCAGAFEELPVRDWQMLLCVLDWLAAHPHETRYARQLPIRGIDTKWLERHRGAIDPLVAALSGEKPAFAKAPYQVRVRFLDEALAPCGLTDIQALPDQLAALPLRPRVAIICENLVSMLTFPQVEGAIALHGGGYAARELATVGWLGEVRVLYWGDLDSNGFAILDELRAAFPHAESLMMDAATLQAHRDLCVSEPTPNRAALTRLTPDEQAALSLLLAADPPLRLEQERIEWSYALARIQEALRTVRLSS